MAIEWDNTNRGALFTNKRKEKDTHPSFTGRLNVDGKEYWLSAWGKTSKAGEKFLSLSVAPVEEKNTGPTSFDDLAGDEIPF